MEKRKNEILSKLYTIKNDPEVKEVYRQWVEQIERYICEKSDKPE